MDVSPRRIALRLLLLVAVATITAVAVAVVPFLAPVRDRLAGARPAWIAAVAAFQLASELSFVAAAA